MKYGKKVKITLAVVLPPILLAIGWGVLTGWISYKTADRPPADGRPEPAILGTSIQHYDELNLNPDQIEPFEDGLRTDHSPGQYEWWYFDAHFEDGSKVVVVYFTKDYMNPMTGAKPSVSIAWTSPDGVERKEQRYFSPDESFFSTETCDVKIGENSCKGDLDNYSLIAATDTLQVNLNLASSTPAWRPGTGFIHFGDKQEDYFAWLPAIPEGEMSGTITVDGVEHTVSGSGYHDHNWGNTSVAGLLKKWWWARVQCGDYTVIAVMMTGRNRFDSIELPVFMVADSESVIADAARPGSRLTLDVTRKAFHPDPKHKEQIAQELLYEYTHEDTYIRLNLTNTELLTSSSLLDKAQAGWLKKALVTSAGRTPWYTRFTAEAELEIREGKTVLKATGLGTQEKMDFE